jgi:hypothetical protein
MKEQIIQYRPKYDQIVIGSYRRQTISVPAPAIETKLPLMRPNEKSMSVNAELR